MRGQGIHDQHIAHVKRAAKENDVVVIVFGSYNARVSQRNPFSFKQRCDMLFANTRSDDELRQKPIIAVGVDNHPNDFAWRDSVLKAVQTEAAPHSDDHKYTLYGSNKDSTSFYLNLFPQWKLSLSEISVNVDATEIRELYFKGQQTVALLRDHPHVSQATLQAMAHFNFNPLLQKEYDYYKKEAKDFANYKYPDTLTFSCADSVVVVNGKVLMIRRGNPNMPGYDCIALPGGIKNRNESFFDASLRELDEETCIQVSRDTLLDSHLGCWMFDDPRRSEGIPRVTMAQLYDLSWLYEGDDKPFVAPKDDAKETMWVDIEKLYTMPNVYDDHAKIVYDMITLFKGQ
jgi:bifunctional NMN adenylyltransferase/nudix hydrolase